MEETPGTYENAIPDVTLARLTLNLSSARHEGTAPTTICNEDVIEKFMLPKA